MPPLKTVRRLWNWDLSTFEIVKVTRLEHVEHFALKLCVARSRFMCRMFPNSSPAYRFPTAEAFPCASSCPICHFCW